MFDYANVISYIKEKYNRDIKLNDISIIQKDVENDINVHKINLGKIVTMEYIAYIIVAHIDLYRRIGII